MKILIMGSGGVGGYYGSVLFRNGHDVKFIARGEHLEKINSNGLIIKSVTSGNYTVKSDAYDSVPINFTPEIILFTVKAYDNSDAIEIISSAMSKTTSLITLQNGVGSSDLLKNRFPSNNIISGVTYVDSFVTSPGNIVEQGGPCNIIIGNQFQPNDPTVSLIRDILDKSKINIAISSSIESEIWSKLIYICALSGMMCITRSSMHSIMNYKETYEMTREIVQEVYQVGGAQAIAALAYGTKSIRPVNKIFVPGNAYVVSAKKQVFGKVGIDLIAGPSEIVVVADKDNKPNWVAADLIAQSEHDENAQSILITDDLIFA